MHVIFSLTGKERVRRKLILSWRNDAATVKRAHSVPMSLTLHHNIIKEMIEYVAPFDWKSLATIIRHFWQVFANEINERNTRTKHGAAKLTTTLSELWRAQIWRTRMRANHSARSVFARVIRESWKNDRSSLLMSQLTRHQQLPETFDKHSRHAIHFDVGITKNTTRSNPNEYVAMQRSMQNLDCACAYPTCALPVFYLYTKYNIDIIKKNSIPSSIISKL